MIRIITDSAADLTAAELTAPGVTVVPMTVTFADGTSREDDGSMTKDEFFARLAEDSKLPRTSQPSPAAFMQAYEEAAAAASSYACIKAAGLGWLVRGSLLSSASRAKNSSFVMLPSSSRLVPSAKVTVMGTTVTPGAVSSAAVRSAAESVIIRIIGSLLYGRRRGRTFC